jgi:heat shock protein beta
MLCVAQVCGRARDDATMSLTPSLPTANTTQPTLQAAAAAAAGPGAAAAPAAAALPRSSSTSRRAPLPRALAASGLGAQQQRMATQATARPLAAALPSFAPARRNDRRALHTTTAAAATAEAAEAKPETFQYQAEVDRLMDMIVNSLYSNRDVFLRELISNASDALDKLRFTAVTDADAMQRGGDALRIRVSADAERGTVTIEDTGVGMTREQLLSNLGTIARSGTRKFMESVKEAKGDASLIGQFGVGFYSAFLVADRVTVVTRSFEGEAGVGDAPGESRGWVWESAAGSHEFKVRAAGDADVAAPGGADAAAAAPSALKRGTRIILHLKEDAKEMADPVRLARLIRQYSQFIQFPIELWQATKESKTVTDEAATAERQKAADAALKEGDAPVKVEPVTKADYVDVWGWRTQNDDKPLWTRPPKDVSEGDYAEFFKAAFGEFLDPLAHVHFNVEGTIEFSSVLFVPGMAPFDQQQGSPTAKSRSIKLYVRRVFISDEFDEDLMPRWLSFVKGVVDSSDLPLNVSREILQESRVVRVIRKQLVRRALEMMDDLASKEGGEDYRTFWESFGRQVKVGAIEDQENRPRLAKLLRFFSSHAAQKAGGGDAPGGGGGGLVSLQDYASRMRPGQKAIYYMAADSVEIAAAAPFVERLVQEGVEVLYLTEPIDEAVVTNLASFDGRDLVDVTKEGLELDDVLAGGAGEGGGGGEEGGAEEEAKKKKKKEEAAAARKAAEAELAPVTAFLKEALGERVEKVVVSSRLTDSPCALVTSKFGWSANMERIMRSQAMGDPRAMEYMRGRKILEINPKSDVVQGVAALLGEGDDARARDCAELLYETSLLTSGFALEQPRDYANKVFTLMRLALGAEAGGGAEEEGGGGGGGGGGGAEVVEPTVVREGDGK